VAFNINITRAYAETEKAQIGMKQYYKVIMHAATLSAIAKNNKNKNFVWYLWSRFNSTMRLTIRYNKSTMLEKCSNREDDFYTT